MENCRFANCHVGLVASLDAAPAGICIMIRKARRDGSCGGSGRIILENSVLGSELGSSRDLASAVGFYRLPLTVIFRNPRS
eukprot:261884-Pyramimonas_sp.AAC.2